MSEIEFRCAVCNEELSAEVKNGIIVVVPCPDCLQAEYDSGEEDGCDRGTKEGFNQGYERAKEDFEEAEASKNEETE